MPDRLEIYSASIELDSDEGITVGGYAVLDNVAGIVRWVSLTYESCDRWLGNHRFEYPEVDEDDDLS